MSATSGTIRVALVEDDPQVREGFHSLVSTATGYECVAACASAKEALKRLQAKTAAGFFSVFALFRQ